MLILGGGPPPGTGCSDHVVEKVKTLIGPALEGIYTIFDGDAEFMREQQASVSTDTQLQPIEYKGDLSETKQKIKNGEVIEQ